MIKGEKDLPSEVAIQKVHFDIPLEEGILDVHEAFRQACTAVIRKLNLSRHQLAAFISELTGRDITKDMIDKYTSCSSMGYGMRAEDLPAFVAATGSVEPVNALFEPLGFMLIGPKDIEILRLARLRIQRQQLDDEISQIEHKLGAK